MPVCEGRKDCVDCIKIAKVVVHYDRAEVAAGDRVMCGYDVTDEIVASVHFSDPKNMYLMLTEPYPNPTRSRRCCTASPRRSRRTSRAGREAESATARAAVRSAVWRTRRGERQPAEGLSGCGVRGSFTTRKQAPGRARVPQAGVRGGVPHPAVLLRVQTDHAVRRVR